MAAAGLQGSLIPNDERSVRPGLAGVGQRRYAEDPLGQPCAVSLAAVFWADTLAGHLRHSGAEQRALRLPVLGVDPLPPLCSAPRVEEWLGMPMSRLQAVQGQDTPRPRPVLPLPP